MKKHCCETCACACKLCVADITSMARRKRARPNPADAKVDDNANAEAAANAEADVAIVAHAAVDRTAALLEGELALCLSSEDDPGEEGYYFLEMYYSYFPGEEKPVVLNMFASNGNPQNILNRYFVKGVQKIEFTTFRIQELRHKARLCWPSTEAEVHISFRIFAVNLKLNLFLTVPKPSWQICGICDSHRVCFRR